MTAPLRTAGQFLSESGFGSGVVDYQSFPEYPDLNTQLQALRKLDPQAPEIPWVEYALSSARQARLDDDRARETAEIATARKAVERSFKRRTPASEWPKMAFLLTVLAIAGYLLWQQHRKKQLRRRRQNIPMAEYADDVHGDDDADDEDEDEDEDDV